MREDLEQDCAAVLIAVKSDTWHRPCYPGSDEIGVEKDCSTVSVDGTSPRFGPHQAAVEEERGDE